MKALILAAGYATRLYPITKCMPKPLLPVVGKPMVEYILDKISFIDDVDEVFIVTNEKFYPHFKIWHDRVKAAGVYDKPITIINDKTTADGTKIGAVGDINYVIKEAKVNDDLLIIAGDNLFEFNLQDFVDYFNKRKLCVIALHDIADKEIAKRMGVVELNPENKLIDFKEKPEEPKTTLIAICCYLFPKEKLSRVQEYLDKGNKPDAPGYYVAWLYENDDVYGWVFSESWFDVGDIGQYVKANEQYGGI
jgi:glucose-1-phosphate thymidylyltransferase